MLNNIGSLFKQEKNIDSAMVYYNESYSIRKASNDIVGMAVCLNNIGSLYESTGDYTTALEKYQESKQLFDSKNTSRGIVAAGVNVARMLLYTNKTNEAQKIGESVYQTAVDINDLDKLYDAANFLKELYTTEKNYELALQMFEKSIQLKDSIQSKNNQKAAIRQQTKYEFEKEQLIKEQEAKEQARLETEKIDRRNSLQYSVILVAILAVFGLVMSLGFVSVSPKVAEGLIFFAFLILFEFLLVLFDPYIDNITGGAPAYKLLANALLAALIFPAHSFFERTLKNRLVKNKKK